MRQIKIRRPVHITFQEEMEGDDPAGTGDMMIPEPSLAAEIVHVLLHDLSVSEIHITAETSLEEMEENAEEDS